MKKILVLMTILGLVILSTPTVMAADGVNTAVTGASVTNVVPVSSGVAITLTAIDLTEATHTHVAVTATVTDNNSCEEITGVTAKLFRTNVAGTDLIPSAYADNGSTLVRVTVGSLGTTPAIATGSIVDIAGTTSAVYDGAWTVTVINSTTVDLQGSTYSVNPAAKGTLIGRGTCATDPSNCYAPVSMTIVTDTCTSGGTDLSADYTASIEVQYYADATDAGTYEATTWSLHVIPSDAATGIAGDDDTAEMNTLTALDVSTPITYGALALNGITPDTIGYDTTVTNTGNKATIGVQVKSGAATSMECTIGNIPVGKEKYDAVSTTTYALKTALKATDETVADVSAAKGASGNTDTVGWGLQMPATGVAGTCAGTVVFTAI